jgi:superfamily II DNA or RNA helicase
MTRLTFQAGTLMIQDCTDPDILPSGCKWDERSNCYRARAADYAAVVMAHVRAKIEYTDDARAYSTLSGGLVAHREPRPYQIEALDAWRNARFQGLVVLPTGAGKTYVAEMAIDATRRSTLVVAPTLDLVQQWYTQLRASFEQPVGLIGGGEYDIQAITVSTYDSAYLHMENIGDKFGLIIFDECHHLPSAGYRFAADSSLAPFRLGLTATPDRADGAQILYDELIGKVVLQRGIEELAGLYLADYETIRIAVDLTPSERATYDKARATYREFVVSQGIRMSQPSGWGDFVQRSARSDAGRLAMKAYREHKQLSSAAPSKLGYLEHLLRMHKADQTLIFTQDNATAYEVSRRFLIPAITHQTKVTERAEYLAGFSARRYDSIVTSKVLNEGVDVPAANIAIVLSGSGSVREHVQRLGRILRKADNKKAILYELVATGTSEQFTSQRRREHNAYR